MTYQKTKVLQIPQPICPRCDRVVDICWACECELNEKKYYCDCCKSMNYHLCKKCGEKKNET